MHALLVTHALAGVTYAEHAELAEQLAPAFEAVPGLVSLMRLENAELNRYGGLYLFDARGSFDRFVASELYVAVYGRNGIDALEAFEFTVPRTRVPA